jgi:hypothetical protein
MPSYPRSRLSRGLFVASLFALGTFAPSARATVVPLSTAELTERSPLVVVGRVLRTHAQWTPDHASIVTLASVVVDDVVKGQWGRRRIFVEHEGGTVDDMTLQVTDTPSLAVGERVVLFLEPAREERGQTIQHVVGAVQGKYGVDEHGVARKSDLDAVGDLSVADLELPLEQLTSKVRKAVK